MLHAFSNCEYGVLLGDFCKTIKKHECDDLDDLCCKTCAQLTKEENNGTNSTG